MTGYMFRNAQYRLELQQSLEQIALPDDKDTKVFGHSLKNYKNLSNWCMNVYVYMYMYGIIVNELPT